ncbi:MAG: hypothetical protein FMNOHCHN_03657 [Ignavibacteriaceae bacterium]|nr:hypothetical protein [Ignavibacteriaceae bacterium]
MRKNTRCPLLNNFCWHLQEMPILPNQSRANFAAFNMLTSSEFDRYGILWTRESNLLVRMSFDIQIFDFPLVLDD